MNKVKCINQYQPMHEVGRKGQDIADTKQHYLRCVICIYSSRMHNLHTESSMHHHIEIRYDHAAHRIHVHHRVLNCTQYISREL